MAAPILLDLSRLLSSAERPAPSGIDRVEMAYARHFLPRETTQACAMAPWGRLGLIDRPTAAAFVESLDQRWRGDPPAALKKVTARLRRGLLRGEDAIAKAFANCEQPPVYLLVSHHHLHRPGIIQRLLQRLNAPFVCLIHDLIPFTHAEYARPGQPEVHASRMQVAARLAQGLIFNSAATAEEFRAAFLGKADAEPPSCIAPLGLDLPPRIAAAPASPPYFVCVSTIEPRKNHLLLLNLWRDLAARMGERTPRLVLVGRRGWENENIIDMIERCRPIQGIVAERNDLADGELASLLAGARASLLPSFAEGYGLPIGEALAAGVPVLCSDLPALREVGGAVPEYLDPLDGRAWREAIVDYAGEDSPRRAAQMARLRTWSAPRWSTHFEAVESLMARACAVK